MSLRVQISEFLTSHPRVARHPADKVPNKKVDRYTTATGTAFVHEHEHLHVQHLWVPATPHMAALGDRIEMVAYPARALYVTMGVNGRQYGRHSSLKTVPELAEADLLRFTPKDIADVTAIIDALD